MTKSEGMRTKKEVQAMRKSLQIRLNDLEQNYRERWAEARKKDIASPGFVPAIDVIGRHEQLFDAQEEARKSKLRAAITICDWFLGKIRTEAMETF